MSRFKTSIGFFQTNPSRQFLCVFFFRYKWIKSDFPPFKLSTTAKCKQFVYELNTFTVYCLSLSFCLEKPPSFSFQFIYKIDVHCVCTMYGVWHINCARIIHLLFDSQMPQVLNKKRWAKERMDQPKEKHMFEMKLKHTCDNRYLSRKYNRIGICSARKSLCVCNKFAFCVR